MSPTYASSRSPAVPIELVVHEALGRLGDELHSALRAEVSAELGRLLRRLGIPGMPEVRIRVEDAAPDVWARIFVNGHRCPHPEELAWRVRTYVLGGPVDVRAKDGIVPWLQELLGDAPAARVVSRFCRIAVAETVKGRLSILLGDEQAAAYARGLRTRLDLTWLRTVLGEVLDLKTSIGCWRSCNRTWSRSVSQVHTCASSPSLQGPSLPTGLGGCGTICSKSSGCRARRCGWSSTTTWGSAPLR
jgi:hypothetical protein